jgi:hypothetical protein
MLCFEASRIELRKGKFSPMLRDTYVPLLKLWSASAKTHGKLGYERRADRRYPRHDHRELQPPGFFGNTGTGIIRGPALLTLDDAFYKEFHIREDNFF